MYQRVAVNAFHRRCRSQRRLAIGAEEGSAFHKQERTKPFAAVENTMTHRGQEPRRANELAIPGTCVEQCVEHVFDLLRAGAKQGLEINCGDAVHPGAMAAKRIAVKPVEGNPALRRPHHLLYAKTGRKGGGAGVTREPEIVVEPRAPKKGRRRRRRGPLRTWLRRGVVALLFVAALPFALTLVYAVPGTRPVSTLMIHDFVTLQGYDRRWVSLDEMGPNIIHAVMMSEDGQFCSHRGVDVGEFRALLQEALAGEQTRGGSTITMQTAKNLYLWHGRSYIRKAIEIPLAIYIDAVLSKRRIMEIYLNIAEWAPGVYGVEAGAWHHFGRPARELTRRQAALMAVTLPSPATRNPANPTASLNRVANTIERRARGAGGYVGCLR
jgi:monofunctional glycosyltransferase